MLGWTCADLVFPFLRHCIDVAALLLAFAASAAVEAFESLAAVAVVASATIAADYPPQFLTNRPAANPEW